MPKPGQCVQRLAQRAQARQLWACHRSAAYGRQEPAFDKIADEAPAALSARAVVLRHKLAVLDVPGKAAIAPQILRVLDRLGVAYRAAKALRDQSTWDAASGLACIQAHTVPAATSDLVGALADITRQVSQSAHITAKAAQDGRRLDEERQTLSAGADRIGNVAQTIAGIAGQTNLLALNATIEAARAGDAGKGFAVVASEVTSLALKTRTATEEMVEQIAAMQATTEERVRTICSITGMIEAIQDLKGELGIHR